MPTRNDDADLAIVVGSYAVLFVSLAAHAAQFAFLLWFENPRELFLSR
jgi:hypothetical protein